MAEHFALGTGATPPDAEAPTAPSALAAEVVGDDAVSLTWDAATDNVAVTGYEVHRSDVAGFAVTEATKVGDSTSTSHVEWGVDAGTWFYRVVAVDAAGNVSEASDEVEVEVLGPDTQAPSVPSGVAASASGSSVDVSWSASSDDRGVAGYVVYRSDDEAFEVSESSQVAEVADGTSFTDEDLEPGDWFYRVVAVDEAGNASDASSAVAVEVLGPDTQAPSVPSGVAASASGSSVDVSWSASSDDRGVAGYVVYRSEDEAFEVSESSQVAEVADGTSFTDAGLAAGAYYYRVVAVDAAGNASEASASVGATVDAPPADPVTVELYPSEDTFVHSGAQSTNYGSLNQLSAMGNSPTKEVFLKFALPEAPAGTVLAGASLRLQTTTSSSAGSVDDFVFGWAGSDWAEGSMTYPTRPEIDDTEVGVLEGPTSANTVYDVELSAEEITEKLGADATLGTVSDGTDSVWFWSKDRSIAGQRPQLTLHFEPGSTGPVDPEPDTQAPSVPSGVTASASGSSVEVTWSASTDDTGVTRYVVYRSDDEAFEVSESSQVAEVADGTSFTDAGLAAGAYYYRVVAVDAAGNVSEASASRSATVEEPVGPDTQAPSVPSGVAASASGSSVDVSWSASSDDRGVAGYVVYRSDDEAFEVSESSQVAEVADGTSFTDEDLEPGDWFYRVVAVDEAGNASDASSAVAVEVLGPDTQAPSVPSGVAASASGSSVDVSWSASSDDRGVAGYVVYRSEDEAFEVSESSQVAEVADGTSFTDAGLAAGAYYYRVVAVDAAGNASEASASVGATVDAPPADPVTVELYPSEDTFVHSGAQSTNYGSLNQLSAMGNSPTKEVFLKFALPEAPAGTVLAGASLRLQTTTSSSAGSVDDFVFGWAGSDWAEGSMTYPTRPEIDDTEVGVLEGPTSANTVYDVELSAEEITEKLGADATLGTVSDGTDSVWFWSKDRSIAGQRPQLTLQFEPVP
ncbi:hypothetical protein GCM10025865_20350 [Paraoerskovia sediminicola]|uniref:Fibronectin type-III domain-containing protein n=1 Tax=Paraoerskovia sediminicola TaxID=1138587 RepID=A0ABM8G3Y2_9CELL|nr:hypothetical protein GCM10025865_20350 [Paraoerskovia sediminicola]